MKKLFVFVILLSLLIPTVALAGPEYPMDGEVTCERVWASNTNNSSTTIPGYGAYIFVNGSPIDSEVNQDPIAPGETVGISWNPPDGFVGSARVLVILATGYPFLSWNEITADLDCHDYLAVRKMHWDCDGWEIYASIRDYGVEIATEPLAAGVWTNPYVLEVVHRFTDYAGWFTVTLPDGSTVRLTSPSSIQEPEKCLVVLEHEFEISKEADCDGWGFSASSSDGGVAIPQGDEAGAWLDPYTLEPASIIYDATWPDGYTETFSDSVDEPEVCQAVHELAFVHTKDCVGWSYGYVLDGVETIIDSGEWNNLLEQEKIFVSFEVFLPEGEIATRTPIFGPWYLVEPDGCHDITIKSHQAADCDGYARAVNLYDLGVYQGHLLFESGVFTDPYALEPGLPAVSFAIPSEYGGGTVDFDALSEPASCQIFRTYKAHQAYLKNNCEGIQRVINLYEGPASDPYQTLVGTHYNETVLFSDPFNLETIPAVTVDVPDAYGADYTFAAMDEPEFCYSTCDVTTPVVLDPVWGEWTPWVYNPANGLEESTRVGTQTTLFVDSVDGEFICGTEIEELSGYQSREVEYSLTVVGIGDCFTWEYVPAFTKGGEMSVVGELEGAWMNVYGPEIAPVPTVSVIWPSGYSLTVTPDAIAKEKACIQCETTRFYPMAAYVDGAAPPGYWQGPFGVGSGVCNVIHPKGQVPSVGRVTTICSLCPDQYEGGYIYQVNHMFYDGWVYKTTCYGRDPHYTYMGYNWDAYVRIGEYTTDGERCSPRVQGCADWIHENAE